jgi:hypothetical protein
MVIVKEVAEPVIQEPVQEETAPEIDLNDITIEEEEEEEEELFANILNSNIEKVANEYNYEEIEKDALL